MEMADAVVSALRARVTEGVPMNNPPTLSEQGVRRKEEGVRGL
jgi:hypothetical protein